VAGHTTIKIKGFFFLSFFSSLPKKPTIATHPSLPASSIAAAMSAATTSSLTSILKRIQDEATAARQ
jgi:biotin transporter BioY